MTTLTFLLDNSPPLDQPISTKLISDSSEPKTLKEICGQVEAIKILKEWVLKPSKPLLVIGPPGVGKHLIPRLAAEERGQTVHFIAAHDPSYIAPEIRKSKSRHVVVTSHHDCKLAGVKRVRMDAVPDGALFYWLLKKGFSQSASRAAVAQGRGDVRRAFNELQAHVCESTRAKKMREDVDLEEVHSYYVPAVENFQSHVSMVDKISSFDEARMDWCVQLPSKKISRLQSGSGAAKKAKWKSREALEIGLMQINFSV